MLAELGGDDRGALRVGGRGRLLERGGELRVRPVGREREVPGAGERILGALGEQAVRTPPLDGR